MHCKTVNSLLRIRVRGHFVMSNTKNHEYIMSHYVMISAKFGVIGSCRLKALIIKILEDYIEVCIGFSCCYSCFFSL